MFDVATNSNNTQVQTNFRWRDRTGEFHNPKDMHTRHLFFTLRMIWNNTLPESARLPNANLYTFGKFYTKIYLVTAIKELTKELVKRKDMKQEWKDQLQFMINWLRTNQLENQSANITGELK